MKPHTLRQPTEYEHAIFHKLMEASFPGKEAVERQLVHCQVSQIDEDGSLKLHTPTTTKAQVNNRVPVEAYVKDKDGLTIHYMLHIVDGLIHELEIYKDDSSRIIIKPKVEEFELMVLGK